MSIVHRLYNGEINFDFIGRRKRWYLFSTALIVLSIAAMLIRGFNFGIDFSGGNTFQVPASATELDRAQNVVEQTVGGFPAAAGEKPQVASTQMVGSGTDTSVLVKTTELTQAQAVTVAQALAGVFKNEITDRLKANGKAPTPSAILAQVSNNAVSASWGSDISQKAAVALIVFLVAVSIFLAVRYRWQMAVARSSRSCTTWCSRPGSMR